MAPVTRTSPTTERRYLISALVLGMTLSGCSAPPLAQFPFEQHEIVTGCAKRQTVLTGFLLDGPVAELAVVQVDENQDRRLRVYSFGHDTWVPGIDVTLRPGVLFVDVAGIGGRDRLLTYETGRVNWFDPRSGAERLLVQLTTSHGRAGTGEIPHIDVTRDLNGDGLDDLVVPDVDGFWVSTQSSDGSFADPVKLGPPEPFRDEVGAEHERSYAEVGINAETTPWYLSRVHGLDHDQDGRSDLAFWNEDHFDVHRQDAQGSFDPVAEPFAAGVPFDSDGTYSHAFGFDGESALSLLFGFRKESRRTVLHSFRDVNGDRVPDLLTHSLKGRSLLRQRSSLAVHLGESTPDGPRFAPDASTTISPRGRRPLGYSIQKLEDLDGDGRLEVVVIDVRTGIGGMCRALLGNSIAVELEFYRLEDGLYPDEPTATRSIEPDLDVFGRRGPFFPTVLLGDVDGDGRSDLLVGQSRRELRVFLGVPGPELFARQPQGVSVAVPDNERNSRLVDLDKDGKQDLLIHHPSATEPHRVTLLIAPGGRGNP